MEGVFLLHSEFTMQLQTQKHAHVRDNDKALAGTSLHYQLMTMFACFVRFRLTLIFSAKYGMQGIFKHFADICKMIANLEHIANSNLELVTSEEVLVQNFLL